MTKGRFDTFTVDVRCSHPPPLQIISFFSALTRGGVCSFKWQKFCASQLPRVLISDLQKLFFYQAAKNGSHISFVRGGDGEGLQYGSRGESIFQQQGFFSFFLFLFFFFSLQYGTWRESIFQQQGIL